MTLGPHYGSLKSRTLLVFVFFLIYMGDVSKQVAPLYFSLTQSPFDTSVLESRLHEDLQILRLRMRLEIEPSLPCP